MEYKDHPDVKAVIQTIVDKFNPKTKAIWQEMPSEFINDLPVLQRMISDDNLQLVEKYEKLIVDNNLDPNMYHMATKITDQHQDDFAKNRVSIWVYPELNKPQGGND